MSTQLESPASPTPQAKAVFISYSRRDKRWVDEYLLRQLTAAKISYAIDEQDFEIGGRIDDNIRRSVAACGYMLLVMTPDWARGKWTHFESLLGVQADPTGAERHLLPIKLKNCEVPPHIATRLFLDLSKAKTRDQIFVKLLRQIGASDEEIAVAQNSVAKKTLLLLIELLEDAQVREKVTKLEPMFRQIQQSNDILVSIKQLHYDLQGVQLALTLLAPHVPAETANQADWQDVWDPLAGLCVQLEQLLDHAAAVNDDLDSMKFIDAFDGLADNLDQAFQAGDARRFSAYLNRVSAPLQRSLTRVNDRILKHVKDRRVDDLLQILQDVYEEIGDVNFDDATSALVSQFREGIDALAELDHAIYQRVGDHETLQNIEGLLAAMCPQGEPTLYDISIDWPRIDKAVRQLQLTDTYDKLLRSFSDVSAQLGDNQCIRDDRFEEAVIHKLKFFIRDIKIAFNKLNIDLLAFCKKLEPHSDELQKILKRMQSDDAQV